MSERLDKPALDTDKIVLDSDTVKARQEAMSDLFTNGDYRQYAFRISQLAENAILNNNFALADKLGTEVLTSLGLYHQSEINRALNGDRQCGTVQKTLHDIATNLVPKKAS